MEEYIRGKGIATPAATITASQQLLSQPHRRTFDNCVAGIVPNGPVTTVQEVQQMYDAFALTFMDGTARRKQKRYMASGSIQKPKSWSSRQVATRLTTLNRYLTYLPGTAQSFHTNPDLRSAILQRLREWQSGRPISPPSWNCSFKKALKAQNSIGWYPLLLGHVSNSWRDVQQAYYTSLGLDNTGKQWVKQLILQLFNISWDMWEHRNGIKHNTIHPAKAREIQQLDLRIHDE
jgi:hypothetical protein